MIVEDASPDRMGAISGIPFPLIVLYLDQLNRLRSKIQVLMIRLLFFLSALVCFPATPSAQPLDLRYDLKEGQEYRFKQVETTTALAQANDGRGTSIDRRITRYFTITVEKSGMEEISYLFVQDTAIVSENSEEAAMQRQHIDVQNVLTKKRIRVRQSSSGKLLSVTAVDPLGVQQRFGPGVSDAMFTQRAALLPALPTRPVEPGMVWQDSRRDTLYPSKEVPGAGRGSGLRLTANATEYTIKDFDERQGYRCLAVNWTGNSELEEKIVYDNLEEFTEDASTVSGELFVATDSGLPVFLDVTTEQENTRAVFGEHNNVVPSSIRTHLTLELFSQ